MLTPLCVCIIASKYLYLGSKSAYSVTLNVETFLVQWLSSLEIGTATREQILAKAVYISHRANMLGKGMHPTILGK